MSQPKSTRVAIYARVSTTGHGQDVGLQVEELRQVASQRGWEVVDEFIDDGISGGQQSRPALDRLLDHAREGRVDVVAIWKLDRLARSVAHLLEVADGLNAWGVGLVSMRDAHIDTTTPAGRFTLQILGFNAHQKEPPCAHQNEPRTDHGCAFGTVSDRKTRGRRPAVGAGSAAAKLSVSAG